MSSTRYSMDIRRPERPRLTPKPAPVTSPKPRPVADFRQTTDIVAGPTFGSEFKTILGQVAPYVLAFAISIPLLARGTAMAMQQVTNQKIVAASAEETQKLTSQPVSQTAKSTKPAAVVATPPRQAELQALVTQLGKETDADASIVVTDLKTGATATYRSDVSGTSASLYKLFVANQIYRLIDAGKLSASARATSTQSVDDCLQPMIIISDNTCGEALGSKLGWGKQNASLKTQGYNGTNLTTLQKTSADDVALLLKRLYAGDLLSSASNKELLGYLKDQRVNNRLPLGLPTGTTIAHKTGDVYGYVHDAGIVYGPKTDYVIVVMTGPWDAPGTAPDRFVEISKAVWQFME